MQVPDLGDFRRTLRKVQRLRERLRGEVDIEALKDQGLQIGNNVYVAPWVLIDPVAAYLISIGDGSRLAPRVHILAHDATSREALGFTRLAPVHIGSRVFLGADTLVLPGVTIGDDTVIGAGSLVSSDIPPGSLARGRPARVVGKSADFFDRRKARIDAGHRYELSDAATPEGRARMRREIEEAGEGYIP
jgi:maltose O-acetyltransferase